MSDALLFTRKKMKLSCIKRVLFNEKTNNKGIRK